MPECTVCGLSGRTFELGNLRCIAVGDRLYRLADAEHPVSCRRCIAQIEQHGPSFEWLDVPPHAASVAAVKRRRRRRRSAHHAMPCP
jgi:hypothetical protein